MGAGAFVHWILGQHEMTTTVTNKPIRVATSAHRHGSSAFYAIRASHGVWTRGVHTPSASSFHPHPHPQSFQVHPHSILILSSTRVLPKFESCGKGFVSTVFDRLIDETAAAAGCVGDYRSWLFCPGVGLVRTGQPSSHRGHCRERVRVRE
jgi:hypothetical protein